MRPGRCDEVSRLAGRHRHRRPGRTAGRSRLPRRWRTVAARARSTAHPRPATASTRPPAPPPDACTTSRSCRGSPHQRGPPVSQTPAAFAGRPRHAVPADRGTAPRAAPLIAALTDRAMRAGRRHAEHAGGRLDPPHGADPRRGREHLPDRRPARPVQPPRRPAACCPSPSCSPTTRASPSGANAGMATLWGAATIKVIGAGIDDPMGSKYIESLPERASAEPGTRPHQRTGPLPPHGRSWWRSCPLPRGRQPAEG